jgi:ankyrin repeat protein
MFSHSMNGNLEELQKLVTNINVDDVDDEYNETCLFNACHYVHLDVVNFLLELGANVNILNNVQESPLMVVCGGRFGDEYEGKISADRLEIVKLLIKHGSNVNHIGRYKSTALIEASCKGYTDIVEYLLQNGADPFLKSWYDYTALSLARNWNHKEIVSLLEDKILELLL